MVISAWSARWTGAMWGVPLMGPGSGGAAESTGLMLSRPTSRKFRTFTHTLNPRIGFEYDFASGDSNPSDNRAQAFDPLFPTGHNYQGFQDIFSWKNGHDYKGSVSVDPKPDWKLQADYHYFQLAHSFDAWYDATSAVITRDVTGAAGKSVGSEIDLHMKGKFRELITLWFGYSRFFAGSFVRTTTGRGDRDWAFFQAAFNF